MTAEVCEDHSDSVGNSGWISQWDHCCYQANRNDWFWCGSFLFKKCWTTRDVLRTRHDKNITILPNSTRGRANESWCVWFCPLLWIFCSSASLLFHNGTELPYPNMWQVLPICWTPYVKETEWERERERKKDSRKHGVRGWVSGLLGWLLFCSECWAQDAVQHIFWLHSGAPFTCPRSPWLQLPTL